MCEQLGSPYTSLEEYNNFQFDNETNRNFVKKFRTWFLNKWVTTQTLNGGAYTSALFTGKDNTTKTRCVMCIGSTGGATYQTPGYTTVEGKNVYDFEVGIAPIPQENKAAPKVISQGPSLCIFKKANPQEVLASYLFAKFLTTDYSFQGSVSMNNGYTPVIKSIQEVPAYKEWLDSASTANIQALAVKTTFENADSMYTSPAFWGSSTARTEVGKLMAACLAIESDVGLDAAIKERFENAVYVCKHSIGQ
jgi:multiple sugar transport system substrate-binding protein